MADKTIDVWTLQVALARLRALPPQAEVGAAIAALEALEAGIDTRPGSVIAAERDWRAHVGEHDRRVGSRLDQMFVESGWSSFGVPKDSNAKVPDWCGMAVWSWLRAGGVNPGFNTSFLHVFNVEAFFAYGARRNVNPARLDTEVKPTPTSSWRSLRAWHEEHGRLRRWVDRDGIRARVATQDADLFAPGDVLLIDWSGRNDADHVALVRAWDPMGRRLSTIEGNRTGSGPNGEVWRDAVVACEYDLADLRTVRLMYGVGRLSPLDYGREEVR